MRRFVATLLLLALSTSAFAVPTYVGTAATPYATKKTVKAPPSGADLSYWWTSSDQNNVATFLSELRAQGTGFVNLASYGAKADNCVTDNAPFFAVAISEAIAKGSTTLRIPGGIYGVRSSIVVALDPFTFEGIPSQDGEKSGKATIRACQDGIGDILYVNKPGAGYYGFGLRNIVLDAAAGVTVKPVGVHLKEVSQFAIDSVTAYSLPVGVKLNGANMGRIDNYTSALSDVGILSTVDESLGARAVAIWTGMGSAAVFVRNADIFSASTAAIKFDATSYSFRIRDSWMEDNQYGFLLTQNGTAVGYNDFLIDGVSFSSDATARSNANTRFFHATAQASANSFAVANMSFRDNYVHIGAAAPLYAMDLLQNGNTGPFTAAAYWTVWDGVYQGQSNALFYSDSLPVSLGFAGAVQSSNAAFADVPLTTDLSGRYSVLVTDPNTSRWVISEQSGHAYNTNGSQKFTSPSPAGDVNTDWIFDTVNNRAAGGYLFQIKNQGVSLFGVIGSGGAFINGGAGHLYAGEVSSQNVGGQSLKLTGNASNGGGGADVLSVTMQARTDGYIHGFYNTATFAAGVDFRGGLHPGTTAGTASPAGIYFGTAAPGSGTWVQGSRVFNSSATVGQPKGWICTVGGTPGTWVSEGNL